MTSIKRHVQHHLHAIRSFLKRGQYQSVNLTDRLTEVELRSPECFDKAIFNFMVDFELIWGNGNENGEEHSVERRIKYAIDQSVCFEPFMKAIEDSKTKVSWAVLGKLANSDILPTEHEAFNPAWSINWYDGQYKNLESELWEGEQYLKRISRSSVKQEFLSHGHAHIDYCDSCVTEDIARWDLVTSIEELKKEGIDIEGFVYPCNRHNYKGLLKENNIEIIRGQDNSWSIDDSLIQTPLGFWLSPSVYSFKDIKKIIDKAIENKSFVHPWIHLVECDLDQNDIENFYIPIFEYVKEMEDKGKIQNLFFRDIKKQIRKT